MRRWVIIESTYVVIHVYESVGCFDLVDLRDFDYQSASTVRILGGT